MKVLKYLAVLAVALFAFAGASNAQTLQFLGGGSSALFLELGQAAATYITTNNAPACIWSANLTDGNIAAKDIRTSPADVQIGKVWVVWDTGSPASGNCGSPNSNFNVYSYLSVDSVIGDRCYFAADPTGTGCVAVYTPSAAEADAAGNLLLLSGSFGDSASSATCSGTVSPCIIPTTVSSFLNGKRWFVAGTDVRPEDAKFASFRALQPCTETIYRAPFGGGLTTTTGLGYEVGTTLGPGTGLPIQSFYSTTTFSVIDFNIAGNDPIETSTPVPGYSVNTVGAQPIVVAVSPAGGSGIGAATDINTFTLTLFYNGVLARATDLIGPTANPNLLEVLVREPLSGTFNTFEMSVPNSNQFHTSQELGNCNGSNGAPGSNPMDLQSANGESSAVAARRRVLGTSEMVSTLAGGSSNDNRIGYFFWSASNGGKFSSTTGKYLTVNGVDPLQTSYTGGVLPTGSALSNVTFANLNAGDYPVWSALRLVTTSTPPAGVTNVIAAAQTLNSTQSDFIPLSKLAVWHSHFSLPQVNVGLGALGTTLNTAGDLCGTAGAYAEQGGDAGGANVMKQANHDFCADFGNLTGLINANN
jgi:hypothetical protein